MQLTAKLTQLLPIQTGTGKNGEWKKQDIIVETDGQYPKKVCISIWGDKIDEGQLQIGNLLKIDFDIQSQEYNSKWYTNIKAWKIEVAVQVLKTHLQIPLIRFIMLDMVKTIHYLLKYFTVQLPRTIEYNICIEIKRHEHN
ncbi:MAG: DUF3127 domain-containing protein [Saprospiraceae bacterium]|nr:DUF3127 domain-containing protein [Candidatus Vicinibacter affinis]